MGILKATLEDVARIAGVSTATVSRYINGKGQIATETAARVQSVIEQLNYRSHHIARGLATNRMNAIGFITNYIANPYYTPVIHGIESVTQQAGLDLLLSSTNGEPSKGQGYFRLLGDNNTDGLLVFADALDENELIYLDQIRFPVVMLHQSPPLSTSIPVVTYENKKSAYQLVEHLLKVHGYRQIAYLQGGENQEDSVWREQGYREALMAYGIDPNPQLIRSGEYAVGPVREAVEYWLTLTPKVEAIFAFDDEKAYTIMHFLQRAGLRVPEDIAVVGFDDLQVYNFPLPTITTVRAPIAEAAACAAQILIDRINEKPVESKVLLPTELIVRRTCGCDYSSDDNVLGNERFYSPPGNEKEESTHLTI